jgi:hypothetical protein
VHPHVIDAYVEGALDAGLEGGAGALLARSHRGLQQRELAVVALLRARSRAGA